MPGRTLTSCMAFSVSTTLIGASSGGSQGDRCARVIDAEMLALMEETSATIARGELQPDPIEPWWEGRRENEQTPDYPRACARRGPGAGPGAQRARGALRRLPRAAEVADGLETIRLVRDLRRAARADPSKAGRIAVIENAVRRGEFDATKAECGEQGRPGDLRRARRADGDALGAEGGPQRLVSVRVGPEVQALLRSVMTVWHDVDERVLLWCPTICRRAWSSRWSSCPTTTSHASASRGSRIVEARVSPIRLAEP